MIINIINSVSEGMLSRILSILYTFELLFVSPVSVEVRRKGRSIA